MSAIAAPAAGASSAQAHAANPPGHQKARTASASALRGTLRSAMSLAGAASGAYVYDATARRVLFGWHSETRRTLASNTKLFTSAAVLGSFGPQDSLATAVFATGSLQGRGVYRGNLYLRGAGDPTFGSQSFAEQSYGTDASVEALAAELKSGGLRQVTGQIVGDESLYDTRRGGPESGYGVSIYVGPLSALSFNRGLADPSGSAFQQNPPAFAAASLRSALEADGIRVGGVADGPTPPTAAEVAEVRSPPLSRVIQIQDKASDNFFAETLVKGLPVDSLTGGPLRVPGAALPSFATPFHQPSLPPAGGGTTGAGAHFAAAFAARFGVHPQLVDGSGLSNSDRASPHEIALLLTRMITRPYFPAFFGALPIAGRDGTLSDRMTSGPAHGRCHAKTGTLTGVSALSGYCRDFGGHQIVFSLLMNNVDVNSAHVIQDRIAQTIAAYR